MRVRGSLVAVAVLSTFVLIPRTAVAQTDECWTDPTGVYVCHVSGTIPGLPIDPTDPGGERPPLRYLRVGLDPVLGDCWYWATTPPGLDSWDTANDAAIIQTIRALPPCPSIVITPGGDPIADLAWEVFRSFPLTAPIVHLEPPDAGITGLATYLSTDPVEPLDYVETLPSGIALEVQASVEAVTISWGDGAQSGHRLADLAPYPDGIATHTYSMKTCPPAYRATHPSGRNCHPSMESYPVVVTYTWWGRYRYGGEWIDLGAIELPSIVFYDVDEVVGVLEP